jgi:hypothetical protein
MVEGIGLDRADLQAIREDLLEDRSASTNASDNDE